MPGFVDPLKHWKKPDFYIYKLIEILLPKAMCEPPRKRNGEYVPMPQIPSKLKMVELWAQSDEEPRYGWLKVMSMTQK